MDKLKRVLAEIWRPLVYPFVFLYRIFATTISRVAAAIVLVVFVWAAYDLMIYLQKSHQFSDSGICQGLGKRLSTLRASLGRPLTCLNATTHDVAASEPQTIIFFMASSKDPTPAVPGHSWVVFLKASVRPDGSFLFHEFYPVGFGWLNRTSKWPKPITDFYVGYISPFLPKSIEPEVAFVLGLTWLPQQQFSQTNPHFKGVREFDESTVNSPQFKAVFDSTPEILFVALIDEDRYQASMGLIKEYQKGDYSLFFRDCTTFVGEVAEKAHLYTPPRAMHAWPSDYIDALYSFNRS